MDFGRILDQWEKKSPVQKDSLEKLYEAYEPGEEDLYRDEEISSFSRSGDTRKKPQAVLDLHGVTADEARQQVLDFLMDAALSGKTKVLIIHGKGHHSQGEPVLKRIVRQCLEESPYAGRHGHPGREDGGSGAVWVMIKRARDENQRSR